MDLQLSMQISVYYHLCCEFESTYGEVYSIKQYVIKFVSDLRQMGASTNKADHHDIIKILLKVALNTITLTQKIRHNKQRSTKYYTEN